MRWYVKQFAIQGALVVSFGPWELQCFSVNFGFVFLSLMRHLKHARWRSVFSVLNLTAVGLRVSFGSRVWGVVSIYAKALVFA